MERLLPICSSYIQDSKELFGRMETLGKLTEIALLFTADAISMYTNNNTACGIDAFREIFQKIPTYVPEDLPQDLFLQVLELVMNNNVFALGDTRWLQLIGTTMETSCACRYATLVYGYHEETSILPTFRPHIMLYTRFINDIFGIWTGSISEYSQFLHPYFLEFLNGRLLH